MFSKGQAFIAQSIDTKELIALPLKMANRHGLIAGATGTGKTITVKVLAESFSSAGVPVFLTDVKSDVAGLAAPGTDSSDMQERIARFNIADDFSYQGFPVRFWDIFGELGHPVRTTISEMGPVLMSRLLGLSDVQEGVLSIVFRVADDEGLLLLDLKDLRSMVTYVGDNAAAYKTRYGNISSASVGAIQRALLRLEDQGADHFFGEPALDIIDWIQTESDGRGVINLLDAQKLIQSPLVYATFLLWMLSELFERLPEVGDMEKPRLVFFFDEAHLLFKDAPQALVDKIEQVVKLIRSKGVGVYFCTQSPADIPDAVLAQLGNRIQHALRSYSPADQRAIKAAADSYRPNPAFSTEEQISNLGTGEALVSFLTDKGEPSVVERAYILPPQSQFGPLDATRREQLILSSNFQLKYAQVVDRESAYELLQGKAQEAQEALLEQERLKQEAKAQKEEEKRLKEEARAQAAYEREQARAEKERLRAEAAARREAERAAKNNPINKVLNSALSAATSTVGRQIGSTLIRGILGSLKKR